MKWIVIYQYPYEPHNFDYFDEDDKGSAIERYKEMQVCRGISEVMLIRGEIVEAK